MTDAMAQAGSGMIGELLVAQGLVQAAEVERALAYQRQFGGRLGAVLVRMGALSEDVLLPVLARQLGMPLLDADELQRPLPLVREAAARGLSGEWLRAQELLVWEAADGIVHCVARNPLDSGLREAVASVFPAHRSVWHLARSQDLESALRQLEDGGLASGTEDVTHLRELAEEAPVVELLNTILSGAVDAGASDVHFEPEEMHLAVRYRIDGVLQTHLELPRERMDALVSRIKLVSGLDIAERRLPQDGRVTVRVSGAEMDVRVSMMPCAGGGESVVMRLLPKERAQLQLSHLGMEPDHLAQFARIVEAPHGIVLITGPTGSGKSTTLYAALEGLNDQSRKIMTVEDPVEFRMKGVVQIQVHSEIGYDFARALRSILRQDPDVIMIGEMRDTETAAIAVQSALTGHMVLSTLHTNDAAGAFNRLLDMGLEPFLVASSVRAVGAQRLVRKLCECAQPAQLDAAFEPVMRGLQARYPQLMSGAARWRVPAGCERCRGTGYRGRQGVYELIQVDEGMRQAIMRRAPSSEVAQLARANGSRTLREDGLIKAWRGLTSLDEVLRVTGLDDGDE